MFDVHDFDRASYLFGFVPIHRFWSTGFYTTKSARTRTDIPENHKRCSSFSPTFSHIRAATRRTNSIQIIFINQTTKFSIFLRSEEHTSELQSRPHLVCRLLLEKKKKK